MAPRYIRPYEEIHKGVFDWHIWGRGQSVPPIKIWKGRCFMEEVKIGRVYRHFKGNYYFVENIAYDSETKERMVVYKPLYSREDNRQIWVRPESMFLSEIPVDRPDNLTKQSQRFKLCEEIEKNYIN